MSLDYTQLSTFQQCPEKYRLKFLEQLERVKEEAEDQPKKFGAALHAGVASFYRQESLEQMHATFLHQFPVAITLEEKLYTPANGKLILQQYETQYREPDRAYKVLATEQPMTLELAPSLPYLIKHDAILENAEGIWVQETKTTASTKAFTDSWWKQFEPNSQLSGQVWGCQQTYGRCDGVILNGIGFSYGVRKGFVVECQRQVFSRTAEQIEDWKQNTIRLIQRIRHTELVERGHQFEKHESLCGWCEYRDLCLSCGSPGVREAMYQVVKNSSEYQEAG